MYKRQAQTAGLLPLDLTQTPLAALATGGHKSLLGPAGTGLLVLGDGVRPRPFEVGGTGEDTFNESMPAALPEALEAGTPNVPGLAGLAASLDVVLSAGGTHLARAPVSYTHLDVYKRQEILSAADLIIKP